MIEEYFERILKVTLVANVVQVGDVLAENNSGLSTCRCFVLNCCEITP